MELHITIHSSDPDVGKEITTEQVANGITVERKRILRETVGESFIDLAFHVGEGILIQVVATLIAKYLYDKLKGKTDKVDINNINLDVNVNVFNNFFLETLKKESPDNMVSKEKEQHIYIAKFEFPQISNDELLKSARTLTDRPIFFDGRQLSMKDNRVMGECESGKLEVVVFVTDEELNSVYKNRHQLFGLARYEIKHVEFFKIDATLFTGFSINTENIPQSVPLREQKICLVGYHLAFSELRYSFGNIVENSSTKVPNLEASHFIVTEATIGTPSFF